MKKLLMILPMLLLAGCHDMSGNAWIDGPTASLISQILGFVFLGWLTWFVISKSGE